MGNNFLDKIISELSSIGIDSLRLEARMIVSHVLGVDVDSYFSVDNLSAKQLVEISGIISRRAKHEPLDKILGLKGFYKHNFAVSCDVLSPRPDSEVLVEEAIKIASQNNFSSIIELGVGSGCLILSILDDIKTLKGTGIDKSSAALKIASLNAENLNLLNRVEFIEADYFECEIKSKYDMIISNPPYIPSRDILDLDVDVKNYDPLMALDGGDDGFDHYKRIAEIAPSILNSNGYVLIEAGINQAETIKTIFMEKDLKFISFMKDLSGIERCVIFKK